MPTNRYRLLTLSLILTAAVMTKYAGVFLVVFAFTYLLRRQGLVAACMAVLLPLTAFGGWYIRCTALYGSLTVTVPIARYTPAENIGGAVGTLIQFIGVILGCVLLEILFSRLSSRTRGSSYS